MILSLPSPSDTSARSRPVQVLLIYANQRESTRISNWLHHIDVLEISEFQILRAESLIQARKLLRLHELDYVFISSKISGNQGIGLIDRWQQRYPHCCFVVSHRGENPKLEQWISTQPSATHLNTEGADQAVFELFFLRLHTQNWEQILPTRPALEVLYQLAYENLLDQQEELKQALKEVKREHKRKTKELEEARALQIAMLPKGKPSHSWVELEAYMHTATEVGGDYYDYVSLGPDHLRIVIGDVTGHGFKSGIVVATAKSFFQAYGKSMEPAELMEHISNGIKGLGLRKMYMGLALIEVHHNQVRLWSSGLPPFYRYSKAKDQIHIIRKPGMFLGSSIQPNYESTEWEMEAGDALIAMTDGFPEGIEQYFQSPASPIISHHIRQQQQHSARRMLYGLMGLSLQWRKKELSKDDITLLVLKQKKQES